jgi:hypothetical protein
MSFLGLKYQFIIGGKKNGTVVEIVVKKTIVTETNLKHIKSK